MKTQTLNLEQYIKNQNLELPAEKITKIDRKLEELNEKCFGSEILLKKQLIKQKALCTYPLISPEFLSLSNKKYLENTETGFVGYIHVPRFGVYSLDNPTMKINFGYDSRTPFLFFEVEKPNNLPKIIENELIKGNELFINNTIKYWQTPKEIRSKYEKIGGVSIKSSFHGFIPIDSKEKIKQAQRIFKDIYFVAETKPEEWTVTEHVIPRLIRDPLVIGVLDKDCFLIDKFETTPFEGYISKEFSF